jgi:signal transduction histidine kinase
VRRRLAVAILAVAALAVVLFGVPLAIVLPRFVDEEDASRLERRAVLASRQVPGDFATSADPIELPEGGEVDYALYGTNGSRVLGTGPHDGGTLVRRALSNRVVPAERGENRVVAIPIVDHERVMGALVATEPTGVSDARADRALFLLAGLGLAVLGVGALVARVVAGRLAKPVVEIRDQAVRLGDGDFDITVPRSGIDDLDEAGTALESTARRLDDLVQRERAFSADASHQLRTPLAALRTSLETELAFPRDDRSVVLTEALEDVGRLESTIDQLLQIARSSSVTVATTSVEPLLESLQLDWNGRFAQQDRPLVVTGTTADLAVRGAPGPLRQALDVLLDNALVHGAGRTEVRVRSTEESVTLGVADGGEGFADAAPTQGAGVHGMGLPLAQRLAESCGGRLIIADAGPTPSVELVLVRSAGQR